LALSVLVGRFARRSDLAAVVRATLDGDIIHVALDRSPGAGRQVLQLWVENELIAAVAAEPVGTGRGGQYPLRLGVLDDAHRPGLTALLEPRRQSFAAVPTTHEPADDDASEAQAEDRTLQSSGEPVSGPVASSQARPPPVQLVGGALAIPTPTNPTTVFDPEALLRAKKRQQGDEPRTLDRSAPTDPDDADDAGDADVPVDEDSHTIPGVASRRGDLVSWNVRAAPPSKDAMSGRLIADGKYRLESVIGNGAIGTVYKASHRDLARTVAIKILNPQYRDDADLLRVFRTEARAASQLEHPNVARVYDYGQEPDGLVYIVMEYLSGYTLGSVIGARKTLAVPRALDIMMQVCGALSAAHDRGIVHRDVKPDNIVIVPIQDDEGQPVEIVKVCDFGIAALGSGKSVESHAAGTPEYMAPEQSLGEPVTAAVDVYACGVVLYEMLTGEVPFTADRPYRIFLKHQTDAPRPPSLLVPDLAPALEAVVLRALAKAPAARFKNARALRAELRKIAAM
jgi:tRNA A-37 threonylcarbamoyl transferase component Bud32